MEEILEPQEVSQESSDPNESVLTSEQNRQIQLVETEKQFERGISWFYWIAGLSLVNSVLWLTGAEWSFIIGLGATQMVDAIVLGLSEEMQLGNAIKYVAFGVDLLIAGIYVLIGFLGLKRIKAVIIVGMVFYTLDGLIFLLVGDYLSIAFHGYALFCIFGGLKALKQLPPKQVVQCQAADDGPFLQEL